MKFKEKREGWYISVLDENKRIKVLIIS